MQFPFVPRNVITVKGAKINLIMYIMQTCYFDEYIYIFIMVNVLHI